MTYLKFVLDVEEGWPPVPTEVIPVRETDDGLEVLVAPLFIRGMSVGDTIEVDKDPANETVFGWRTIIRSRRTTVWLLRMGPSGALAPVLAELLALGCQTVELEACGAYAIDVPETLAIEAVDDVLARLDGGVAVAFPSLRHPTSSTTTLSMVEPAVDEDRGRGGRL